MWRTHLAGLHLWPFWNSFLEINDLSIWPFLPFSIVMKVVFFWANFNKTYNIVFILPFSPLIIWPFLNCSWPNLTYFIFLGPGNPDTLLLNDLKLSHDVKISVVDLPAWKHKDTLLWRDICLFVCRYQISPTRSLLYPFKSLNAKTLTILTYFCVFT